MYVYVNTVFTSIISALHLHIIKPVTSGADAEVYVPFSLHNCTVSGTKELYLLQPRPTCLRLLLGTPILYLLSSCSQFFMWYFKFFVTTFAIMLITYSTGNLFQYFPGVIFIDLILKRIVLWVWEQILTISLYIFISGDGFNVFNQNFKFCFSMW